MDGTIIVIKEHHPSDVMLGSDQSGNNYSIEGSEDLNSSSTRSSSHNAIHTFMWIYISPIIFTMGLMGNILIMAVMNRPKLKGSSASIYLPLMALFDTMVLITGIIPEWLEAMDITVIKELHPITCKLEKFLFYTTSDTAIWLLVFFTFDRFVAVCFPLRKCHICRPKNALIFFCAIILMSTIKNLPAFWTRGYVQYTVEAGILESNCGKPAKYFESYIRPWIAFIVVSAIPFLAIMLFNIGIVHVLLNTKPMPTGQSWQRKKERQFSQTTIMCLSASLMFLVTITPSIVLLIGKPYWAKNDQGQGDNVYYWEAKAISNVAVYLNHSLTFFLYCLTGRRFRGELVELFKCPAKSSLPKTQVTSASNSALNDCTLDHPSLMRSASFASVYQCAATLDTNTTSKPSSVTTTLLSPDMNQPIHKYGTDEHLPLNTGYLFVNGSSQKHNVENL